VLYNLFRQGYTWDFNIVLLLVFALAVMIAMVLHELAHALVAYKMGDQTARAAGRLTLNPAKHIDPLGLLSFCLAGFGWAKPVPVNPFNYRNFRRGNFLVSIAGILTNLVLAIFASLCLYLIWKYQGAHVESNLGFFALYQFFFYLTIMNIFLMIFNLLPIFPLDGFNMLVSLTKPTNRYMNFMRANSMAVLMVVMLILIFTQVFANIGFYIANGLLDFWGLIF